MSVSRELALGSGLHGVLITSRIGLRIQKVLNVPNFLRYVSNASMRLVSNLWAVINKAHVRQNGIRTSA